MYKNITSAKIAQLIYKRKNIFHLKIFFLLTRYGGQVCSEKSLGEIIFSANSTRNKTIESLNNLVEMGILRKTSKGYWQIINHRILHKKFNLSGGVALNLGDLSIWLEQDGKANHIELRAALKDNKKILTFLKLAFIQDAVVSCMSKDLKDKRIQKTLKGNFKAKSLDTTKVKVTSATDINYGTRPLNSYDVTSTFISSVISSPVSQDFDWGYSSSTIRKHLLRATEYGYINKIRRTQVIACTQEFKDNTEKYYQKDYLIFAQTVLTTNVALASLNRYRHNLRYGATPMIQNVFEVEKELIFSKQCDSPILSQTDASGNIVALLQEVAPRITFLKDLYRCSNKKKSDYKKQRLAKSKASNGYKELLSSIQSNLVIDLF